MSDPAVTVVIPVWNGRVLLLRLLEKLKRQTFPIAEVLAVDNGSEDGAAEAAEAQGARVLRMGRNLGFSRAVNEGIGACRTELVALVNSDVEPEPEWLAPPGKRVGIERRLVCHRQDSERLRAGPH